MTTREDRSRPAVLQWQRFAGLAEQIKAGHIEEALDLLPADRTDSDWLAQWAEACYLAGLLYGGQGVRELEGMYGTQDRRT